MLILISKIALDFKCFRSLKSNIFSINNEHIDLI